METKYLPLADDFHVHLRQDKMMEAVVPLIASGGCSRVLVMPNTIPPITTSKAALEYRQALERLDASVEYLMTLYLCDDIKIHDLAVAQKDAGVFGVKCYPRGVTTNSAAGVEELESFYPLFEEMERLGLSLHLHGEVPQVPCLQAEERFLPNLEKLHRQFPRLKIVLEHVTTAAAVEEVKRLGPEVAATITAHHLELTVDDVFGRVHNYCKPVAKSEKDRDALRDAVKSGNAKFFLGSDSAPHPRSKKEGGSSCAGVFTSALLMSYLADTFERLGCLERLHDFACTFGAQFFGLTPHNHTEDGKCVRLTRCDVVVPETCGTLTLGTADAVVPFRAGETLRWKAEIADFDEL